MQIHNFYKVNQEIHQLQIASSLSLLQPSAINWPPKTRPWTTLWVRVPNMPASRLVAAITSSTVISVVYNHTRNYRKLPRKLDDDVSFCGNLVIYGRAPGETRLFLMTCTAGADRDKWLTTLNWFACGREELLYLHTYIYR